MFYQTVQGSAGKTIGAMGCDDIKVGNNDTAAAGGYSARPGYDAVTGWGSPKGTALAEALSAPSALV
jgi:kumamolisin